jgi:hypothetical protein
VASPPQGTETVESLAKRIKAKYPVYADKNDADLVQRVIGKYPQYQRVLSTQELQRLAAGNVPSLLQETGSVLSQAGKAALEFYPQFVGSTAKMLRQLSPTGLSGAETMQNIANPDVVIPPKEQVKAIPGATTVTALADLSKRAMGGRPLTTESIPELQSEVARGAGQAAVLGRSPEIEALPKEVFGKTPAENLKLGLKDVDDALATTAGKGGRKAAKMTQEIRTAAPDLVAAADNVDPSLKGAEKLHAMTEEIANRQEEVWQKGHKPGIDRHPLTPVDTQKVANYALHEITKRGERVGKINEPELNAAKEWIETAVRPKMTLREADEFIHELNEDMATQDPKDVGHYGPKGVMARLATLRALRTAIDDRLESLGEKGIKGYNKRWGALDKIREQTKVRAVQLARREARNNLNIMPRWAHIYSFWHGSGIPFLGLGIRGAGLFERTPADIFSRGIERLRRSGIQPTPFFEPSSSDYYRWSGIGAQGPPALPAVGRTGFRTVIGPLGEPITTDWRGTPTPEEFREQMISRGQLAPRMLPEATTFTGQFGPSVGPRLVPSKYPAGGPFEMPPSSTIETYPPAERVPGRYAGMLDQSVRRIGPTGEEIPPQAAAAPSPTGIAGRIYNPPPVPEGAPTVTELPPVPRPSVQALPSVEEYAQNPIGSIGYIQARRSPRGFWQLFYSGTNNEIFPGEKFSSASEARQFWKAVAAKRAEMMRGGK